MKLTKILFSIVFGCVCTPTLAENNPATPPTKSTSSLFPAALIANARANTQRYEWVRQIRDRIVEAAEPFTRYSDDELWAMMFGPTIERSWMVWSNGHCPACGKDVPMYNWKIDALNHPWKLGCPHCRELFPKNDFHAFYKSGLDEHGVFDPKRADRELLFNADHPDPDDPLRGFGVDDGTGYVAGEKRWRFVGCYLIYGHWKQLIVNGIAALANAYVFTGDPRYAHKAGILLDRVADLYPTHDFGKQGWVYEQRADRGYISTWHDACMEFRTIALGYDMVFDALKKDDDLVRFLSAKAAQYQLENPKADFADIQRNIEERLLGDTITNARKISSNYPTTEVAVLLAKAVLGWPHNRVEIHDLLDSILKRATAVDGVTGEKGLCGYSSIGPRTISELLGLLSHLEPSFLEDVYRHHPRLHDMFRFHIDLQCLDSYYPQSGDSSAFAQRHPDYPGVSLARPATLSPWLPHTTFSSGWTFLWRMYQLTDDPAFIQIMYRQNGDRTDDLPYDILIDDPQAMQQQVAEIIAKHGPRPKLDSVNKREWRIAVLRTGEGDSRRAAWIDYDAHGGHGHADGMNLGLFAKGLDLMPEYGYPPVQFGGWGSPRARWYTMTAAHNTVVVDGQNQVRTTGECTLWAIGDRFRAIRTSGPAMYKDVKQYERTVAFVDISEEDSYLLDIFRVVGGKDHARFMTGYFGAVTSTGLDLRPGDDFGHDTFMRNFRTDPSPKQGWTADWLVEDRYGYLPEGRNVHLRLTELTSNASASICEGWIVAGLFDSVQEAWVPRVLVRRQSQDAPLASTFVSLIAPYEQKTSIVRVRRLPLHTKTGEILGDSHVAVEVTLQDGRCDLIVAIDIENALGAKPQADKGQTIIQKDWNVTCDGELCFLRKDKQGRLLQNATWGSRENPANKSDKR